MRKYVKKFVSFFITVVCLVSCSDHLRRPMQKIHITTDNKKIKVVSVDGRNLNDFSRGSRGYLIQRSNKPLAITLQVDSSQKTVYIQPRRTYGWLLNMNYLFSTKQSSEYYEGKRWRYPRKNYVETTENGIRRIRFPSENLGTVHPTISYSVPIFNLKTDMGRYFSGGVLGIQYGVDYFYHEHSFLSFAVGAATNVLPLPIDYFGNGYIERASTLYASIQNNNILIGNFDIGYGVNISRLFYTRITHGDTTNLDKSIKTTGVGLSFSAHYKITPNLKVGFLYHPNLLSLNSSPAFSYQHYMAVQCTFDLLSKRYSRKKANR